MSNTNYSTNNNSSGKLVHFKLSLLAIIVIIVIIVIIFITNYFLNSIVKISPNYTNTIDERISQVGKVYLEGEINITAIVPKATKSKSGKQVYQTTCATCHNTGIVGAPKYGNKADWASRQKQGLDGLLKVALQGKGAMPARGTCGNCSDNEIKDAIVYLLESIK